MTESNEHPPAESGMSDRSPIAGLRVLGQSRSRAEFYDIADRPDVLIKRAWLPLDNVMRREGVASHTELAEVLARKRRVFDDLAARGAHVVRFAYAIGNDRTTALPSLYIVADRVDGKNIEEVDRLPESAYPELDRAYASIFRHLRASYENTEENALYWSDFRNSQIVYGTTADDPEPHAYIVDTDPLARPWGWEDEWDDSPEGKQARRERHFFAELKDVFVKMNEMEYRGNEAHVMTEARTVVRTICDDIHPLDRAAESARRNLIAQLLAAPETTV